MKKNITRVLLCLLLCVSVMAGCSKKGPQLKDSEVTVQIDINQTTYAAVTLPELLTKAPEGAVYTATTDAAEITLSRITDAGVMNIISDGTVGTYTVKVSVTQEEKETLSFSITVNVVNNAPDPSV